MHGGHHCLHADQGPECVDPEHTLDLVESLLQQRPGVMDRGVVDQTIEPSVTIEDDFEEGRPGTGVTHVGDDIDRSCDVDGHHVPPARAQQRHLGRALPASCTGHDCDRAHRTAALTPYRIPAAYGA